MVTIMLTMLGVLATTPVAVAFHGPQPTTTAYIPITSNNEWSPKPTKSPDLLQGLSRRQGNPSKDGLCGYVHGNKGNFLLSSSPQPKLPKHQLNLLPQTSQSPAQPVRSYTIPPSPGSAAAPPPAHPPAPSPRAASPLPAYPPASATRLATMIRM